MAVRRVPLHNKPNAFTTVEDGATVGAVLGQNLYWPDGRLVSPDDFGGGDDEAPVVQNPTYLTTWPQVTGKPRNILEAAALSGVGLIVRQSDGNWIVRVIIGTAGNVVVANGGGDLGNPTIDLADVADSGNGALLAIERDGKGRVTGTRTVTPEDLPAINVESGDYVALDNGSGTLVANRRAKTKYQPISGSLSGEVSVTDGGVRYGAFHYLVDVGSSYDITGVIGGAPGAYVTITNDPGSLGVLGITNDGAASPGNYIKTPDGSGVVVPPGNSVTLRYAYDATLADPGYWVFDSTTSGGGTSLNHRVDDVEALTGDIRFVLDKEPYQDRVAIYDDGGARLKLSMQMGTGKYRYLLAPATGGEIYTVDYWTAEAEPAATTMDGDPPVVPAGTAPGGNVGTPYSYTFSVTGGDGGPYTWALLSGALPAGLSLDDMTGEIYGTPTTEDSYSFVLRATDGSGTYGDTPTQSVEIGGVADPYWANVSSLLYGNSATADETGRTWTVVGDVAPDTGHTCFGLPMLAIGFANGSLTLGVDDSAFDVGGGDWTYEFVIEIGGTGSVQAFFSKRLDGSAFGGILPLLLSGKLHLLATTSGSNWDVNFGDSVNLVAGQRYAVGYRRIGNSWQIWKDNVMVASQTVAGTVPDNAHPPRISEPAFPLSNGTYFAQERFTKGVARDLSIPQTAPWPNA